jgi:hypothetical protein
MTPLEPTPQGGWSIDLSGYRADDEHPLDTFAPNGSAVLEPDNAIIDD